MKIKIKTLAKRVNLIKKRDVTKQSGLLNKKIEVYKNLKKNSK